MKRWSVGKGRPVESLSLFVLLAGLLVAMAATDAWAQQAANPSADASATPAPAPADKAETAPAKENDAAAAIRKDFVNFLHFAGIGRFDLAQSHAESLLQQPALNPLSDEAANLMVKLTEEYENSIDTLLILINNSTIGETAAKVMDVVKAAHRHKRMDVVQINENIRLLAGTPTQRAVGIERLIDSGEYAVPHMLTVLADPREADLHPFVTRALPQLGKQAINALTAALSMQNDVVRRSAAEALGRIGYPQALPFLKRLASDAKANEALRQTADAAVAAIVVADPKVKEAPASAMFADLAERYYAEEDSLQADPREPRANVWFATEDSVRPVDVPREIFTMVMCMRCSRASLELQKDQPGVPALWLAANFRREARLGLDVQSIEAAQVDDPTRPADYPRSIYFARNAGPRYCQLVLGRALKDVDRPVALGAIAALAVTSGPATMVEGTTPGLAEAVHFPDLLVRIKAALALGHAMPREPFSGAEEVVPVLGSALALTGQRAYLVIDPDTATAERLRADLGKTGGQVLVAPAVNDALSLAGKVVNQVDAIFMASDVANPSATEALGVLARSERLALVPLVLYVKEGGMLIANRVAELDPRVARVLVVADGSPSLAELLLQKKDAVAAKFSHREITAEEGLTLALDAAAVLEQMARMPSCVFDPRAAEPALVAALAHPSEELRIASARALGVLDSAAAQVAVARVALAENQNKVLRMAAFSSLAESARRFGARLDPHMTRQLIKQALSAADLELRTGASEALGAMNLPGDLAVETLLAQPQE